MRPFRTDRGDYERSVAIDASTVGDTTVTVAVAADRRDELDILDGIYTAADGWPFLPFRDKSNALDHEDGANFFETVIDDNVGRLEATAHLGTDGSTSERVEAVQSAVLVDERNPTDALVILDGGADKAGRFGRAMTGLSDDIPPVATCIQAELYYPTALLADLCASHLAHRIEHPRHCTEVTPTAPMTKHVFNNRWGPAYHSMVTSREDASTVTIEQRRAETVRARLHCWFEGRMGGGEPTELDPSTRPIVRYAHEQGYDELASRLSEVQ